VRQCSESSLRPRWLAGATVKLIIFVKSALSVLWRERHKNFEPFTPKFLGLANLLIRQTV
jgi:hypothetical protein